LHQLQVHQILLGLFGCEFAENFSQMEEAINCINYLLEEHSDTSKMIVIPYVMTRMVTQVMLED